MTRYSQSTLAALEDSIAVALDAKMEAEIALHRLRQRRNEMALDEAENALLFTILRLTKMIQILQQARRGPHAYRRDQPENLGSGIE